MIDILTWILLIAGSVLGLTSAWGVLTFPDFYSRVHAASISDTLCAGCFMLGLALQGGFTLITVKLFMILGLLWLTSPTSSHALVRAAYLTGVRAITRTSEEASQQPLTGRTARQRQSSNS